MRHNDCAESRAPQATVPSAARVFVCGAGVVNPAIALKVQVYEPAGISVQVLVSPLPLPVAAPVRSKVAAALSVLTTTVPVASVTSTDVATVQVPSAVAETVSPAATPASPIVIVTEMPDTLTSILALWSVTAKLLRLLETWKLAVAPAVEVVNVQGVADAESVTDISPSRKLLPVIVSS